MYKTVELLPKLKPWDVQSCEIAVKHFEFKGCKCASIVELWGKMQFQCVLNLTPISLLCGCKVNKQ